MKLYRIELDENFILFLSCAGFDYHCSVCEVCSTDGHDACEVGEKLISHFGDALHEWHKKHGFQTRSKRGSRRLRRNTSKVITPIRSNKDRTTSPKNGKKSKRLVKTGSTGSDSNFKVEQISTYSRTTSDDEKAS